MAIDCVIFDMDGTLVDSEVLSARAFLDLLPDHPDAPDEFAARHRGKKFALILTELEAELGRSLPDDFEPRYRARVAELFGSELQPMPGAAEMLDRIALPVCVASNGPLFKIRQALTVTGLLPFFGDNLFSAYEAGAWKPAPGLFLHAAARMGVPPHGCLVVEDTWLGIAAAQAAGMKACLLGGGGALADESPPLRVANLSELPDLLGRLARERD